MKKLIYKVIINASPEVVWQKMLSASTYQEWTGVSWPGSFYEGKWEKNEEIRFISKNGSGTLAKIDELKPNKSIAATHIAVLLPGGVQDRTSDMAKGWIGTKENYTFDDLNGKTDLTVEIETNPDWAKMFDAGWPGALEKLKEISEK